MVSFVKAANRAHEILCDKIGVPHDWVLYRLNEVPYDQYTVMLEQLAGHWKFLSVDFKHEWQYVNADYLVDPEWSHLLV